MMLPVRRRSCLFLEHLFTQEVNGFSVDPNRQRTIENGLACLKRAWDGRVTRKVGSSLSSLDGHTTRSPIAQVRDRALTDTAKKNPLPNDTIDKSAAS
jgi:hypothetical protein